MPTKAYIAERTTVWDKAEILEEHAHNKQKVYPTGAGGVTVTAAAGAWTLGAFAEIIPASTLSDDFDIHWMTIEGASAADTYELVLYVEEEEIARSRFVVLGTPANLIIPPKRLQTPILAANSQIQAKLMTAGGGSDTCTISLEYHEY